MASVGNGNTDILIFVEDPGAVNSVVDLPAALADQGIAAQIVAAGHAVEYLASFGIDFAESAEESAAAMLDSARPRMVVAGTSENPDTLGLALIAEARRRRLPSVGFVDGPTTAEYRFRGRAAEPLAFAPEWILVPDDISRHRYEALGHPAARVIDCGHPYFDRVRATGRKLAAEGRDAVRARALPDAPGDRPVVVFLAEISAGLIPGAYERGPDYTLAGRGGSDRRTSIVLEEVLDALALVEPRPYVVLRLHPKNEDADFAPYRGEIDAFSRGGLAHEVVFAADLVVGMTTILLFEAALMGRPTLSVIPRPAEREWLTGIRLGITPAVHTREALRDLLPAAVAEPDRALGKDPEEVIHFGALDRMADFLSGLLADPAGGAGDDT
ncbi:MAG: hypothetical protein ACE5GT_02590 [Rhodospirillales bacterium]